MKQTESIISVANVTHTFGDKTVLKNVDLEVSKGEFVTILGPSGCGKTTLMRIIGGFQKTRHGKIAIHSREMTNTPPHLRPVNTVFQRYALFPHLNVFHNVAFGLQLKKLSKAEIDKKVKQVLKMVSMTGYEERDVNSLSGGQQQRIAIARAIVNEPQVLLLDEPLAALDLKMRKDMQMEIKAMHQKLGITFVYVTHDQEEALTLSDRIVVMSEGEIQQIGTPTEIYNEPANSFVADFIGESNILNGTMIDDSWVEFAGHKFECVDKGFGQNTPVDVVVRPEDIFIFEVSDIAQFTGTVTSCTFKGVHYEMMVTTPEGYEFMIQDYNSFEAGRTVGMKIKPFDIHVMKKERLCNQLNAVCTDKNTVKFFGKSIECAGSELAERGDEVEIEIAFEDIILNDNEEEGLLQGSIKYILYKGDHYHLTIRTDDDQLIYANTNDIWDEGDRVGVSFVTGSVRIVSSKNQ